ncbi:hypothetical protein ACFPN4_14065, partial [Ureibacillus thermophilus]|uniref:hypothetical protein n=1 Tax=Ureibacillus thermophilus TaxID=367743 RepID=UPI003623B4CA
LCGNPLTFGYEKSKETASHKGLPVVVAQVIGYSKKMDVYYPRLGVFVFSLKSRKNKTENSDIIYATVVDSYIKKITKIHLRIF